MVSVEFEYPYENWSKLPHQFIEMMPLIETIGEMKVLLYILRHTWGFQEFDKPKKITLDEFVNGRWLSDGTRIDNGTGLSKPTVMAGLKKAEEHGFITVTSWGDKGRKRVYYMLNMTKKTGKETLPVEEEVKELAKTGKEVLPVGKETLPRTQKETKKETKKEAHSRIALAGCTIYPPSDEIPTDYVEVLLTEHSTEIICPECSHRQEWPTSQRARKKSQVLTCGECGVYYIVSVESDYGTPRTYKVPLPKQDWCVKLDDPIPNLGDRLYCDEEDARQFSANWEEDPSRVVEKLQWAATQEWMLRQRNKVVQRVNTAYDTSMKGVIAEQTRKRDSFRIDDNKGAPRRRIVIRD
jgi:predicted RNA-binding Zn-ribbon protein involved in translation (DUF1610 family)/DNA-binding PadR family transcriptional regulator